MNDRSPAWGSMGPLKTCGLPLAPLFLLTIYKVPRSSRWLTDASPTTTWAWSSRSPGYLGRSVLGTRLPGRGPQLRMAWAPAGEKRAKGAETVGGQSAGLTGNGERRDWGGPGDFGLHLGCGLHW